MRERDRERVREQGRESVRERELSLTLNVPLASKSEGDTTEPTRGVADTATEVNPHRSMVLCVVSQTHHDALSSSHQSLLALSGDSGRNTFRVHG